MPEYKKFFTTWLILVALTLFSASFAESSGASGTAAIFVCLVTIYKGRLVIDSLMGLHSAARRLRWVMLGYFYVLMPIILIAILFDDAGKQFALSGM